MTQGNVIISKYLYLLSFFFGGTSCCLINKCVWCSVLMILFYSQDVNLRVNSSIKRSYCIKEQMQINGTCRAVLIHKEPSWPWSYGRWIYNYLCNQCLSPLMLWVRISIRARCTTLCDKVCQWLATGRWFSSGLLVYSTYKTDRHNITEILLKVAILFRLFIVL